MRKTNEFWLAVGEKCAKPAEATEKLIKNIGSEFQKVKQMMMVSGLETEFPQLRGSCDLYDLYEEYYSLFFPSGGSICPKVVSTENSMTVYVLS